MRSGRGSANVRGSRGETAARSNDASSRASRRAALRNVPSVIPEADVDYDLEVNFDFEPIEEPVAGRMDDSRLRFPSRREQQGVAAASDAAASAAAAAAAAADETQQLGKFQQPDPTAVADDAFPSEDDAATDDAQLVSTSIGDIRRKERSERLRKSSRRYAMRFVLLIGAIVVVLAGWAILYNSPAFSIKNVQVNGVEHLTNEEMAQLASVPADTTLLRVDTDAIAARVKQSSWIESVDVKRAFPDTLEIDVTERKVLAIAEMPNDSGTATKSWAIAEDRMWLMPIPDASSEAAQTTSAKIYEDAESAVHIVDLPYGTKAEIGQTCTDEVVSNALDILQEMTTELSGQVIKVSAASVAETSLFLESGVEIAFGSAEDIRDKERTILKIMEDNPDGVAYINVRMVENPTWRSL